MCIIYSVTFCKKLSMVSNMKIEMKPILNGEKDSIIIDYEFILLDEYLPVDITIDKPVKTDGVISAMSGYMELKLHAVIEYTVECARCLEPVDDTLTVDFVKTITTEISSENDDYIVILDGYIDISEPLIEQILMEIPSKQLCGEDCKGLCPKCGCNLNVSDCGCDTKEIDPRLEILKKFIDEI